MSVRWELKRFRNCLCFRRQRRYGGRKSFSSSSAFWCNWWTGPCLFCILHCDCIVEYEINTEMCSCCQRCIQCQMAPFEKEIRPVWEIFYTFPQDQHHYVHYSLKRAYFHRSSTIIGRVNLFDYYSFLIWCTLSAVGSAEEWMAWSSKLATLQIVLLR